MDNWSSHFRAVTRDLAMSGLLVNEEKSNFVPRQRAQVLGLIVDTSSNCITAAMERVFFHVEGVGPSCCPAVPCTECMYSSTRQLLGSVGC